MVTMAATALGFGYVRRVKLQFRSHLNIETELLEGQKQILQVFKIGIKSLQLIEIGGHLIQRNYI